MHRGRQRTGSHGEREGKVDWSPLLARAGAREGRKQAGARCRMKTTHHSVSTVEREEYVRRRSSVVGRKDEGRWAAGRSEEHRARGVAMDHATAVRRTRRVREWFDLVSGVS
jgi:hypothetical protein